MKEYDSRNCSNKFGNLAIDMQNNWGDEIQNMVYS